MKELKYKLRGLRKWMELYLSNEFAFYSNWCNIILTFDIFPHDNSNKIRGLDDYQKMYISNGLEKCLSF